MEIVNTIKLFLYEKKKYVIALSGVLLILIFGLFWIFRPEEKTEEIIAFTPSLEEKEKNEELIVYEELEYYFVDIKGYVNSPGVYSLVKGKRVVDAINQAGGLQENADTSLLNLSREITDEMVIIVYSKDQINNYHKVLEEESKNEICLEEPVNDACIIIQPEQDISGEIKEEVEKVEEVVGEIEKEELIESSQEKININEASKEELMILSKIGESKALAIIEYREKNGEFKTIEDIMNVSGIGEALFNTIKENITV